MILLFATYFAITQKFSWDELHTTASTNSHKFVDLIYEYKRSFPCEKCRQNFRKEVLKMEKFLPVNKITSKKEAVIWAWMIHNAVNLRIGNSWFPFESLGYRDFGNC